MTEHTSRFFFPILLVLCSLNLFSSPISNNDNKLILSDSLVLQYKFNKIYEISPDFSLLIDNVNDLSYWYYSPNNLFFIDAGYICVFNFFTHKTDTISFSNFAHSFIYKPDGVYVLDDMGIWKNKTLLLNGDIKSFAVGKNSSIFFLENDTLYFNNMLLRQDSIINVHISSFCLTDLGKIIYLKNDTLFSDDQFITIFKYIPEKMYTIKNRIIIYAKDSIFTFDY